MRKVSMVLAALLLLASCGPKGAKKASEFIKKAGAKAVKEAVEKYDDYKALKESEEGAGKYVRKKEQIQRILNDTPSAIRCEVCDGWGVVAFVDEDGYYITDNNGYFVTQQCPGCRGNGFVYR